MRLSEDNAIKVVTSGVQSQRAFSVKMDKMTYKLLSDNLYSDKVLAIVREYSTNAADSNIAAGKATTPIQVHLPTRLEPWFSVSDDGLGLSHEDAMLIYPTYFESTKRDSDAVTGCFGLGCKAGFCYVDAFTVESRFNGILRIYACAIDDGMPTISLLSKTHTNRPNGVEVKVPVANQDDISVFKRSAESILPWLNVPVNCNIETTVIRPKANFKGESWALYNTAPGQRGGLYINFGGVLYHIDENHLYNWSLENRSEPLFSGFEKNILNFLQNNYRSKHFVVLDVPKGVIIDIQTSREDLSYTKSTKEIIIRLFKKFSGEILANIQSEIDSQGSYLDAVKKVSNLGFQITDAAYNYKGVPVQNTDIDFSEFNATFHLHNGKKFVNTPKISLYHIVSNISTVIFNDRSAPISRVIENLNVEMTKTLIVTTKRKDAQIWSKFFREVFKIHNTLLTSEFNIPSNNKIYAHREGIRVYPFISRKDRISIKPDRIASTTISSSTYVFKVSQIINGKNVKISSNSGSAVVHFKEIQKILNANIVVVHDDDINSISTYKDPAIEFVDRVNSMTSNKADLFVAYAKYGVSELKFLFDLFQAVGPDHEISAQFSGVNATLKNISYNANVVNLQNLGETLIKNITGIDLSVYSSYFKDVYDKYPLLSNYRHTSTVNSSHVEYVRALDNFRKEKECNYVRENDEQEVLYG
jgi:hypothetical protein